MATLLVQEAMGFKVDREAVAMAVLPQLWQMAMGPRAFRSSLPTRPRLTGYLNSAKHRAIPKIHGGDKKAWRSS